MSQITQFLQRKVSDNKGRQLADIWAFSDFQLEHTHNYIQWLFPIDKPSANNRYAPVLTENDIELCRQDMRIQENLIFSFNMMLKFWGIERQDCQFILIANQPQNHKLWLTRYNHNQLRISRVIRSLGLLGQIQLAKDFQYFVIKTAYDSQKVSEETMQNWLIAFDASSA